MENISNLALHSAVRRKNPITVFIETSENRPAATLVLTLGAAFLISHLLLATVFGIHPPIPYGFGLVIGLYALPFAVCLVTLGTKRVHPALAVLGGLVAVMLYAQHLFWILAALFAIITNRKRLTAHLAGRVVLPVASLILLFATVANCNYIFAIIVHQRLQDPLMEGLDAAFYSAFLGKRSYIGVFPLITGPAFNFFQNAYCVFFSELLVTAIIMRDQPRRFFGVLTLAYALGFAVFFVFPTVGPTIYFPESFAGGAGTLISMMGRAEYAEFHALLAGKPLSGLSYSVACPSLHVLGSLVMLGFLRRSRTLFWIFLPMTCALILSTVLLGRHYVLDAVAGGAFACLLWRLTNVAPSSNCH